MTRALIRSFLISIAVSSAVACKQSEGDPCQVKSDCDDGLICCPALQTARGTCIDDPVCPAVEEPGASDAGGSTDDASSE